MKHAKPKDPATKPIRMEPRFQKFARALMAVPKKELDRELAKHEHKQRSHKKPMKRG